MCYIFVLIRVAASQNPLQSYQCGPQQFQSMWLILSTLGVIYESDSIRDLSHSFRLILLRDLLGAHALTCTLTSSQTHNKLNFILFL